MWYAMIGIMLLDLVKSLVLKTLTVLGVGAVTYVGVNFVIGELKDYVLANFVTAPVLVQHILGLLKVDVAINIIFSAVAMRLTLAGVSKTKDTIGSRVWKKPGPFEA